jgi:hypothetical protein
MGMRLSEKDIEERGFLLVAKADGLNLFQRPMRNSGPWVEFYLNSDRGGQGRRAFWLAHNGERFARNTDAGALLGPVREWAEAAARRHVKSLSLATEGGA